MIRNKTRGPRRSARGFQQRKRVCRFCIDKVKTIDYKDIKSLESFLKERGRIISNRITGNCAKHQRQVTEAIKQARYIALLPYCLYR